MQTVAALYHFTRFDDPDALRTPLMALCEEQGIKGTLILAGEGINGTIAGSRAGIGTVLAHIRALPGCANFVWKESEADAPPFRRMKIHVKSEIVTMGQPGIGPGNGAGRYVAPADWNALISSPDVALIDTRNDYEVAIGTFEGAVDPKTESFRAFPKWWRDNKDKFEGKRIAMFCTGGIRCEKSTAFLRAEGVEDVYHLQGGILKYLEEVPEEESSWNGACFVFDRRVSVEHALREGEHVLCYGCRFPLTQAELSHPDYEKGVSCHHCAGKTSAEDKARFRERQGQIDRGDAR